MQVIILWGKGGGQQKVGKESSNSTPSIFSNQFMCQHPTYHNRNHNLKTSKALHESQAHQSPSLFTSAARNQRGVFQRGVKRSSGLINIEEIDSTNLEWSERSQEEEEKCPVSHHLGWQMAPTKGAKQKQQQQSAPQTMKMQFLAYVQWQAFHSYCVYSLWLVVSRLLSVGCCQSVVVSRLLSVCHCQPAVVRRLFAVGCCQSVVASLSLSVGCCQSVVVSRLLSVVCC